MTASSPDFRSSTESLVLVQPVTDNASTAASATSLRMSSASQVRGDRRDRLRHRYAGAVPARVGHGQVDRCATGSAGADRRGSGECEQQAVLTLEEPVTAHSLSAAALAGILAERRDLDRAHLGT